jgi:hypothetical protein
MGEGFLVYAFPEICPACGVKGSIVPEQALWDHLEPEGITIARSWTKVFVCLNSTCDCLYFSLWRWVPIRYCNKSLGFKKNSQPPYVLCHCLGFTIAEILRDGRQTGPGSCVEVIRRHVAHGALLCERTNPSGRCCWEQVQQLLVENS